MTNVHTGTGGEISPFEVGQKVTLGDVRRIVAPGNTLDLVEEARLRTASEHLNMMLSGEVSGEEAINQEEVLRALGAEAVLAYLPGRAQ